MMGMLRAVLEKQLRLGLHELNTVSLLGLKGETR